MASVSVLINSYNYSDYVIDAVESALAQSVTPDEVIVVDDGSTDNSVDLLTSRYASEKRVKILKQRNQGQLFAFVLGMENASGDLICFLDADDKYQSHHIEEIVKCFADHKDVEFVFTAHRCFGSSEAVVRYAPEDLDLGYSVIAMLRGRIYVGSVTSTLAIRRSLALTLMPPMRQAAPRWRIRADDCLVYGASLAGARKYFLANPTVLYRIHGGNNLYGQVETPVDNFRHGLRRDTFVQLMCDHLGLGPSVRMRVVPEFLSLPRPARAHLREYIWLHRQFEKSLWKRLRGRIRMYLHYRRNGIACQGFEEPNFKHG
jgi:glycosyltransferase involved in cell wall biosynthesis